MKISVYELLGLVKDGKAPKKIMYNSIVWEYVNHEQDYRSRQNAELLFNDEINNIWIMTHLNTQIEILEEEKEIPEKLNLKLDDWTTPTQCDIELSKKIDEIIDYLKSKGE